MTPKQLQILQILVDGPKSQDEIQRALLAAGNQRKILIAMREAKLISVSQKEKTKKDSQLGWNRTYSYNVYCIAEAGLVALKENHANSGND